MTVGWLHLWCGNKARWVWSGPKDHFLLCFCIQFYLHSSVHKIKTSIAGGFLVLTTGTPLVLLLLCIEFSAALVLLSQALLIFCQCDRLSNTLTMPGTLLCAAFSFGINFSLT